MQSAATVLVTGGSGFLGSRCVIDLLSAGFNVRITVRHASREAEARRMLQSAGVDAGDRLSSCVADLRSDANWLAAVAGCRYVLHVASPFPETVPKDENDIIGPARDGTIRVLRASREAGVRRVVVTSSFAAIGYGHEPQERPFDESSWTNLNSADVHPYIKSKTLAERAAWDFIAKEGGSLELSVVNPVGIFGPLLSLDTSTSIVIVQRLIDGMMPGCPKLRFGVVDVRDVSDLHLRAMQSPAAKNERFLAVAGNFLSIREMGQILRRHLGNAARKVPSFEVPNWLVRIAALRIPAAKQILPELGKAKNATSDKAKHCLGWQPRSSEEALVATGESLLQLRQRKVG